MKNKLALPFTLVQCRPFVLFNILFKNYTCSCKNSACKNKKGAA